MDILENCFKFYVGEFIISEDKVQLPTKMFDIWEYMVKMATDLEL